MFITLTSFVFYGWWDWRFLFLIIGSGLIDFAAGDFIKRFPNKRKTYLLISIIVNLGSLSVFKYSTFFAKSIESALGSLSIHIDLVGNIPEFALILPVGISFYTFQSLSYTIDIYRGRLTPTKNIFHFFSYLSMFPQLVAGPIVRAKDLLKQLEGYKVPNKLQLWNGIKMVIFGLFQKMVIADNLSFLVDSAFENKSIYDGSLFWWTVMIAFSFQIYADFSGYSLIARGIAKMMGYHFRMNFDHPYLSKSLKEFWSRWHISLSTWFRDYVYIPLGGSRKGIWKGYFFLSTTMLLSGLWHGANFTFIIWGGIHAFFLSIEKLTGWTKYLRGVPFILIIIVFVEALLGWVYFRAESVEQANQIVLKLLDFTTFKFDFIPFYFNAILYLSMAILIEWSIYLKKTNLNFALLVNRNNLDVAAVSFSIVGILFFRGEGAQFIYFQF